MFFILSKILLFLLSPAWWIVFLVIALAITKNTKRKRVFAVAAILIFVVFTNPLIYRSTLLAWQFNTSSAKENTTYEAGILLGGLVRFDKDIKGYFTFSSDRFIQTLSLYNQKKIKKIIITGGSGSLSRPYLQEAPFLKNQFILNNIPDSNILVESKSRNTEENAMFTKKLIDSANMKGPFLLISSASHLRRASFIFDRHRLLTDHWTSDHEVIPSRLSIGDVIPDLSLITNWQGVLKEMVGLLVYKIKH